MTIEEIQQLQKLLKLAYTILDENDVYGKHASEFERCYRVLNLGEVRLKLQHKDD